MNERNTRLIRLLPMPMLFGLLLRTVYAWYTHQHSPTAYHYWAISLFLLNVALYLIRFDYGVVMTGLVLLLGSVRLIAFDPQRIESRLVVGTTDSPFMKSPFFSPVALLLLLFYILVNWTFFSGAYRRYRPTKRRNKA